jgi:hypothetical protein
MRFSGLMQHPLLSSVLRPRPELRAVAAAGLVLRWSGRIWIRPNAFDSAVVAVLRCSTTDRFHPMVVWQAWATRREP